MNITMNESVSTATDGKPSMTLIDNTERNRFELQVDDDPDSLAYIDYQRRDDVMRLLYARVPDHLNGRGIGSRLVKQALDLIRARGERMVPVCGFIRLYVQRHPEYQDLLAP